MIIGFTGARNGMTDAQKIGVLTALGLAADEPESTTGLHGDCVGADADFDEICRDVHIATICRPCTFANMRAYTQAKVIASPVPPMQRNRAIVADADVMIACPPNDTPIKKGSGTWATIGFTRKAGKRLYIVYPNGRVEEEN